MPLHQRHNGTLFAKGIADTAQTATTLFRTNPSLVYFYDALEFVHEWMLRHGEAQPMEHEPCGLVRTALPIKRPHHAKQLMCAHALLAGAEQMNCQQPLVNRNVAVLKNRAHGHGKLLAATAALPKTLARSTLGFCLCRD